MTSFHAMPVSEVVDFLRTDLEAGLASEEASRRSRLFGPNTVAVEQDTPLWMVALRQLRSIVVVLLLAAAAVAWVSGDRLESAAISAVLLINALIGFVSEWRAAVSLANLRALTAPHALVKRGSRIEKVDAAALVPGDLVLLEAGDCVPADLRLVRSSALRITEAALTGESIPSGKDPSALSGVDTPVADQKTMAWMGTIVVAGSGEGLVAATGLATELGRIGSLVAAADKRLSPLEQQVERLGRRLMIAALVICGVVGLTGALHGLPIALMIQTALSLAVAAVPEALPAVTSLALAAGLWRLAKAGALVRRLPAVETLGCTTVICVDKTGTLTENRIQVSRLWSPRSAELDADRLVEAGLLACSAALLRPEMTQAAREARAIPGDPTEVALLVAAVGRGLDSQGLTGSALRADEVPFDPAARFMAVRYAGPDRASTVYVKGAPEVILARSGRLSENTRVEITEANAEMAADGLRVLAVATRRTAEPIVSLRALVGEDLDFLGLIGMVDPPRPGVREALEICRTAGIRPMMLTGDQHKTAEAIGRQLGLPSDAVRSRVGPEEKLNLIRDLQERGEIVAMTGDGVNDTPALAQADIGIAMGRDGTAAARETADLVLTDDNFTTIVRAVKEGRVIDENLRKVIRFLFSCNLSEILTIFAAILLGFPAPLLPLQILWVNLVTDILPAVALVRDPATPGIMQRQPREQGQALLDWQSGTEMVREGALLAAGALTAYFWAVIFAGGPGPKATTMAFMALVLLHPLQAANSRSRTVPWWRLPRNPLIVVSLVTVTGLQWLSVSWPPLSNLLGTTPLTGTEWLVLAAAIAWPAVLLQWKKRHGEQPSERRPA